MRQEPSDVRTRSAHRLGRQGHDELAPETTTGSYAGPVAATDEDLDEIVMLCVNDYASQTRGKGFPLSELPYRKTHGMGLAPTNLVINAFGETPATPWASRGELLMMPDMSTELLIPADEEHPNSRLLLADLLEFDGSPWGCCPRHLLRRAITALRDEFGLQVKAAFEHEFHYTGADDRLGDAYLAESVASTGRFPGTLLGIMRQNGITPESFLPEFGPKQFEVTNSAALGITAADQAVQVREVVRQVARRFDSVASFSPVMVAGAVGNGVHVHFSLTDLAGNPVSFDPADPDQISGPAGTFVAGILRDMPNFVALTAASGVSYDRLQPNKWSATFNNFGRLDREAGVRLCAVPAIASYDPTTSINFEYRAADVSGNPYLVLGALVWSGLQGLRDNLPKPPLTLAAPESMSPTELQRLGLVHLPTSLPAALSQLEESERIRDWLGDEFLRAYLMTKRAELELLADLSEPEQVAKYEAAY